jgi:hypothetical protein
MNLMLTLLIAHLFADFPLQTNALAKLKEERWIGVFLHVLVHVIVTALLIDHPGHYWPLLLGIGIAHFAIDGIKLLYAGKKGLAYFLCDQALHVSTLTLTADWAQRIWQPAPRGILPDAWLLPLLGAASIPALMVLFWVWTTTLSQEYTARFYLLGWAKRQLLALEQRVGLALFALVFLQPTFHALPQFIQGIWP